MRQGRHGPCNVVKLQLSNLLLSLLSTLLPSFLPSFLPSPRICFLDPDNIFLILIIVFFDPNIFFDAYPCSGEGLGGFGAEPGQVQQGSGEGSEKGLGGFGAERGQVQQDLRPFNTRKLS